MPPADAQSVSDFTEATGGPFLLYTDGDGSEQVFSFAPDATHASVGRRPPADLLLDWDQQVSRLHARFERVEDDWELLDEGLSRNGTFVNGERLGDGRRLQDGDTLRFGTTTVIFRAPRPEQPSPPPPAPARGTAAAAALSTTQRRVLVALCRPHGAGGGPGLPATEEQIADELFLSVGTVDTHLRVLCAKLGVEQLPGADTRALLVDRAFATGLVSGRDL